MNNSGKRRVSEMKLSVRMLCRYFNDFRFTVPKIYFECFGRGYWLTCRPIARQSKQMLSEASEEDLMR